MKASPATDLCMYHAGRVAESKGPRERWQLASWLQSSKQQASLKLFSVAAASAGFLGALSSACATSSIAKDLHAAIVWLSLSREDHLHLEKGAT